MKNLFFQDALSVPYVVENNLGKPVTLIFESKGFKFFKYGENPSEKNPLDGAAATAQSPQLELSHGKSVELDLFKQTTNNSQATVQAAYVSQLKQQSEQEEASLRYLNMAGGKI